MSSSGEKRAGGSSTGLPVRWISNRVLLVLEESDIHWVIRSIRGHMVRSWISDRVGTLVDRRDFPVEGVIEVKVGTLEPDRLESDCTSVGGALRFAEEEGMNMEVKLLTTQC